MVREDDAAEDNRPTYVATDYCVGFEQQAPFLPRLQAHALQMGVDDPSCQQNCPRGRWSPLDLGTQCSPDTGGGQGLGGNSRFSSRQYIAAMAKIVWPQDDATQEAWIADVLHRLRHEGGPILEEVWATLPPLLAADQAKVAKTQEYFAYHCGRLDYPRYRAQGLSIGSGVIESACKSALKQRERGSGMHWKEAGEQAIATLRAMHRSGRWHDFFDQDPWSHIGAVVATDRRMTTILRWTPPSLASHDILSSPPLLAAPLKGKLWQRQVGQGKFPPVGGPNIE